MPFPHRLTLSRLAIPLAATVAAALLLPAATAHAEPDSSMCSMNSARGSVPAGFAVAACVDGSSIWLRNSLELVVPFKASGDVIRVDRSVTDFSFAAIATHLAYPDPLILLPGDTTQVSIGSGQATVVLGLDPDQASVGHAASARSGWASSVAGPRSWAG